MKRLSMVSAAMALTLMGCQSQPMEKAALEPVYFKVTEPEGTSYNVPLDKDLQAYTVETCQRFGLFEPEIVFGLMERESGFDKWACSPTGDIGLMQINPITFGELQQALGTQDLSDPKQNIEAGIYILSRYEHKYKNWSLALMAYNLGETGAREYWEAGIFTSEYSRAILDNAKEIEEGHA